MSNGNRNLEAALSHDGEFPSLSGQPDPMLFDCTHGEITFYHTLTWLSLVQTAAPPSTVCLQEGSGSIFSAPLPWAVEKLKIKI